MRNYAIFTLFTLRFNNLIAIVVLAEIANRVNLRKQLSSTRLQGMPVNPMRIANSQDIPLTYTQTLDDTRFLLYDSYDDPLMMMS